MKSLITLIFKSVIFLAIIYIGILTLMNVPQYLQQQAQNHYHAIFEQPQTQAKDFASWQYAVQTAIKTDQQTDLIKQYGVYLLFPALRQRFTLYYQQLLSARQTYQQISLNLDTLFSNNPSLKRSWELAVLTQATATPEAPTSWTQDLYQLFNHPIKTAQPLVDFVQFNQQKQALLKQLKTLQ